MERSSFELLAGVAALAVALYYYLTSTFYFWRSRGVVGPNPELFFGNFKDVLFNKSHVSEYLMKLCQKYKDEPMFGIFARRTPILIVKDPEYVKNVLIKDFSAFCDRGVQIHEKIEPLSQHLLFLESERWKPLRANLSPTFTSGKLREMFYLLTECADHFEDFLETATAKNPEIECRDITAKFTTDVIGSCVFGLKMNALAEEESEFRRMGRKIFDISLLRMIKLRIKDAAPWLFSLLGPLMYDYELNGFFINTMAQTLKLRTESKVKRNDFVDLLLEIKKNPDKLHHVELTDTLITAQAFVFFAAGFETSSTTISNALYALALNQSVQDKLRDEIRVKLKENNGKLTFDSIKSMKYMHKVFNETLRKYPPAPTLIRCSMREYTFPGTNVTIPKGTRVWIPVYGIHHDPNNYADPETFNPERFDEENINERHPSCFLPFGDGPRNCIGARFANYQTKVGLATILKNYKVDVCNKTSIPYVINPRAFLLAPKDGIVLKFIKLP
ncbi:probable cytochrome P450 6a13 [Copidosoma floridanum]|uniref:probable cytochrome P450 6a13 n=1 Tax=Copidosoma floridanum TaxID=29053 RepID=UPI0006C9BAA2|nr:probable cytochrome P450 6a13 [Copidosoma floridanum]